jgi:hypothetical protein
MGIFWVASYPKSGNTWMRTFLANVLSPERPVPLDVLGRFCTSEASAHWARPFHDIDQKDLPMDRTGMEVRQKVQESIVKLNPKSHVFIKTHNKYGMYEGLPLIRPDLTVGAVYMVRDPRDVAVSLQHHWNHTIDRVIDQMAQSDLGLNGKIGEQIFEVMGSWSDHVRSWTAPKPKNTLVLRYEDCLADPESTFGRLAKMLKLTQDESIIREAIEATSFDQLKRQEQEQGFSERPEHASAFFRKGKAGGWRESLRPQDVKRIERKHAAMMKRFDYEPEYVDA